MPSQFEKTFASSSLSTLYATFGTQATYTAPDGSTATVTVCLNKHEHTETQEDGATIDSQTGDLKVRLSELSKAVKDGRFTVDGHGVWTITTTPKTENGQHYCDVARSGVERLLPKRSRK